MGYGDARTIARRVEAMQKWLAKPSLPRADKDAEYAAVYEIDLAGFKEAIRCHPDAPDAAKPLSSATTRGDRFAPVSRPD